jgi:uncharacterized protein
MGNNLRGLFTIGAACLVTATAATAAWREDVSTFAQKHLQHTAWGVPHSERDLQLALNLANEEGLSVDNDVLFAAAYLHDMGGFPEFEKPGVDHAVRSAELVGDILRPWGFPMEKLDALRHVILAHTYYGTLVPISAEARVFHDADVVDFLGHIGVARIFSLSAREVGFPSLSAGLKLLETFPTTMQKALVTHSGKRIGQTRAEEMTAALMTLREESLGGESL